MNGYPLEEILISGEKAATFKKWLDKKRLTSTIINHKQGSHTQAQDTQQTLAVHSTTTRYTTTTYKSNNPELFY